MLKTSMLTRSKVFLLLRRDPDPALATRTQIQTQITDSYLKQMLEGITDSESKDKGGAAITFDRRRFGDDDDSDIDLDGL